MINAIKYLYPAADPLVDFAIQDNSDGRGPFIAKWNEAKLGPKPDKAKLDSVATVAATVAAARVASARAEKDLEKLNAESIGALLEWAATQPSATERVKALASNAATLGAKIVKP